MHPVDRAFVEGFDVQTDIEQDYTNRVDLLDSGISRLRPGGGTALYDSLYKTCRDQMLTLKQSADVRKAIVLVSDGDDDYSRATEDDAIKMCQRAETIVYTISTNTGPSRDKGDDVLLRISDATGGRAFFPTRMEDVSGSFLNIEAELRSQYSLGVCSGWVQAGWIVPNDLSAEPGSSVCGAGERRVTSRLGRRNSLSEPVLPDGPLRAGAGVRKLFYCFAWPSQALRLLGDVADGDRGVEDEGRRV